MRNQKRRRSSGASSEQGFIFPEDGLHKAMAALPWAVLRDMLFPQDRKGPRVQLKVPSDETRRKRASSMTLAVLIALGFCGSERWDVKTLTDRGAGVLQPPQKVTVEQLLSLRPPRWSSHVPRHRVERLVVVVEEMNTAYALGLKLDDVSLGAVGCKP